MYFWSYQQKNLSVVPSLRAMGRQSSYQAESQLKMQQLKMLKSLKQSENKHE
jgi:hypothetical protein